MSKKKSTGRRKIPFSHREQEDGFRRPRSGSSASLSPSPRPSPRGEGESKSAATKRTLRIAPRRTSTLPLPRGEGRGEGERTALTPKRHAPQRKVSTVGLSTDPSLSLFNRQRTKPINTAYLRRIIEHLLTAQLRLPDFDLVIHLVNENEMTRLNETRLRHAGSTDVITFDYSGNDNSSMLAGELFVCVDEALLQARRFKVTWQSELVRYIVHGVLHLQGFDDTRAAARRRMKAEENRRVRELAADFDLSKVQRRPRVGA